MMYPYMTLADGTEICHTQVFDENGERRVEIYFEKPVDGGFKSARCQLPSYTWLIRDGYTEEEMDMLEQIVRNNAHLFYKYGESGGILSA